MNKAIEERRECFPGVKSWGVNSALGLHIPNSHSSNSEFSVSQDSFCGSERGWLE